MAAVGGFPAASSLRFLSALLLPVALLIGAASATAQENTPPSRDELRKGLRNACELRMRDLEQRGEANLAAVQWQKDESGVHGEYTGYSPDYVCDLSPGSGEVPVGRMKYQEIHFEKRGNDVAAAMEAPPSPVRIEDVTQIFVYRRGLWE